MKENIGGLQIPMENILGTEHFKRGPNLHKNPEGLILRESFLHFYVFGQGSSIAVLIDEVVVVGGSEHLQEFYDVGMVYFGQDCYFVVGELGQFGGRFELLHVHGFYGEELL